MTDARRLAAGTLAQQAAQAMGLVAMFAIVTVLARELTLAELGVYGLVNALAGYLLIVQNAAAGAAVRAMAAVRDEREGSAALSTSLLMYVAAGALAAVAIAALGVALAAALDLSSGLAAEARRGAVAAGVVTFVGWPATVYRDALRARGRLVLAASCEAAGIAAYTALVLALAFAGAPLWAVIGAGAAIPLMAGLTCMTAARATRLPWRVRPGLATRAAARDFLGLAGHVSLAEAASAAVYVVSRAILGVFRSPAAVGLIEGPIRAHNLIRALNGALTVAVLPAAVRYRQGGDDARLRELLVRGSRYALAGIVPIAVAGAVLAGPILDAWLGPDFRAAGTAMAIMLGHWLLNGIAGVAAALLIATDRAADLSRWAVMVAAGTVALALVLASPLGVDGIAIAMAASYVAGFPYLLRATLRAVPVPAGELARRAFAPAWALGAVLAVVLVGARAVLELEGAPGLVAALALGGCAAYWLAYYALWLSPAERSLARDVVGVSR
jgi:O-antigen/teichoic acid export membrane protein